MRLIRAKDYQDVSRKAANIIAAQIQAPSHQHGPNLLQDQTLLLT